MIGFDLETTHKEPELARIVTAAVTFVGGGEATDARTWLADPGIEVPDEAAAIHGVTTERARAEGRPVADVVREVVEVLTVGVAHGWPVVDFNARYDLTVLDREARRHGVPPLVDRQVDLLVVDPLVIDKQLDRYRKGSRKLEAICQTYGASLDTAHEAVSDAVGACRAAWVLAARGDVIRKVRDWQEERELAELKREWYDVRDDLPKLHVAQARWAYGEAMRLAEYFRGIGEHDKAAGVRPEWPVIP